MKLFAFLICTTLSTSFISCKKDADNNDIEYSLKGHWNGQTELGSFEGHWYEMWFCTDSFKIKVMHYQDIIYDTNNCYILNYTEYMEGIYSVDGNSLMFNGIFMDSLFQNPNTGCYRVGDYNKEYILSRKSNEVTFEAKIPGEHFGYNTIVMEKDAIGGCE